MLKVEPLKNDIVKYEGSENSNDGDIPRWSVVSKL